MIILPVLGSPRPGRDPRLTIDQWSCNPSGQGVKRGGVLALTPRRPSPRAPEGAFPLSHDWERGFRRHAVREVEHGADGRGVACDAPAVGALHVAGQTLPSSGAPETARWGLSQKAGAAACHKWG